MSENNNLVENSNPNLTSQSFSTANDSSSLVDSSISTFLIENKEIKLDLIEKVEPSCSSSNNNNNNKNETTMNNTDTNIIQPSSRKSSTFSSKSKLDKKSLQKNQNEQTTGLGSIADSCTVASINGAALTNPSINNSNTKLRNKNLFDTTSLDSSSSAGSLYSSLNHNINANINTNNNNNNNNSNNNNNANVNTYSSNLSSIQQTPINLLIKDPIIIRGGGNITIFGVSNKFNEQFPSQLNAKLAPEEFRDTIKQINNILSKELSNSFKWLVFGSIFCCCTLGCSLLPVIFMNKKAKLSVNKLLEMENQRLYLKLGLKWKLTKIKYNSNSLLEYVLLIEFLPTILLYQPD